MVHPDHETRVGAHRIFSAVLVPISVFPRSCLSLSDDSNPKAQGIPRILSRVVSVFSSSATLFQKPRHEKQFSSGSIRQNNYEKYPEKNYQLKAMIQSNQLQQMNLLQTMLIGTW